jgi:hypothetical protein
MNCDNCTIRKAEPVPFIVHEGILARFERTVKRLWIVVILLILLLAASNGAWIWYESQFVDESVWQEDETGDGDAYVAGIGDVNSGEDQAESDTPSP